MPTTTVSTIGSGGDYSTLQAWEDAANANLVTADVLWEGRLISAATNLTSTSTLLTVNGSTTDTTRYKFLTTAASASFRDHASVQSNALRWNSSNGASIECTGSYGNAIEVTEANFRISKLQVRATGTQSLALNMSGSGAAMIADGCIFEGTATGGSAGVLYMDNGTSLRNCLVVQRSASANNIVFCALNGSAYNCTFAVPSNLAAATRAFTVSYGVLTLSNCAVFGATADVNLTGGSTLSATTCYTSDASPSTGFTNLAYDTSTGSGFENITDATRDFRIKSTSGLKDVGTTDATFAATDIAGTSRPSGSAYDVGAWEYFVAVTFKARGMLLGVG